MRVLVSNGQLVAPDSLWLYLLDAKRAILGGALSEGGNLLNWLDTILKLPSLDDTDKLIADMKPDGHGLTILPFVSGERSPGWHSDAHATILGLQTHITPPDLLRAGMESLAYQLQQVYQDLKRALQPYYPDSEAKVMGSGGALHNSQVLQGILADTLNAPIYPSLEREASARGAALLALESLGLITEATASVPELGSPANPDQGRHAIYQKGAERQKYYYQLLLG
jgi:gluconokinase